MYSSSLDWTFKLTLKIKEKNGFILSGTTLAFEVILESTCVKGNGDDCYNSISESLKEFRCEPLLGVGRRNGTLNPLKFHCRIFLFEEFDE